MGPSQAPGGAAAAEPAFLPPFANDENRALDAHIQAVEQQLQEVDVQLEDTAGRASIIADHLTNVQQEISYAQHRVDAERREVETEEHLQLMADKEAARTHKDMARLRAQRAELGDRITSLQASIFAGSERLDQFRVLMNWNQEELEQWSVTQQHKEDDNQALEEYRRQDEGKLRQLAIALDKLTQQVAAQREALDAEVTDTQAAQIQLDHAAADFRQLHAERQALVRQWDEARDALKGRDEAIQAVAATYAERKVWLKQQQAQLDAQARFLAGEIAAHRELQAQITFYERSMSKAQALQAAEAAKLEGMLNQVDLAQAALSQAASDLAAASNNTAAAQEELRKRRQRLERVQQRHALLQEQLQGHLTRTSSMEAKVLELERLRKSAEAYLRGLQQEHQQLKTQQFKAGQALQALRQAEKELVGEIAGGQGQARNLAARQRAVDAQLSRQDELMYAVDFGLQDIEQRIARAGGHRSDDEARALNNRIADLSKLLEAVSNEHAMLTAQMKQAELDLTDARRGGSSLSGESKRLLDSLQALQLQTGSVTRGLKEAISARERQLVEHDVLKLQVQRLRDVLCMSADQVHTLESRKAHLQLSLDEQRHQIEVHRDSLRSEMRLLKDDMHRVTLELRDRQAKASVLGVKFDTVSSRHAGTDQGGGEEPKSQAYYIVKAAQEREELLAAGDALDARITQCEAEVEVLTSTLAQMQTTNTAYAGSLRGADSEDAVQEQRALRQQLDGSYCTLKGLRQQEAALAAEVGQQEAGHACSTGDLAGLSGLLKELAAKKADTDKQLAEQQGKQSRALAAMRRARELLARHASMQQHAGGSAAVGVPRPGSASRGGSSRAASAEPAGAAAPGAAADARSPPLDAGQVVQGVQCAQLRAVTAAMLQELAALEEQRPDAGVAAALALAGFKLPAHGKGVLSRASSRASAARSSAGGGGGSSSSSSRSLRSGGSSRSVVASVQPLGM